MTVSPPLSCSQRPFSRPHFSAPSPPSPVTRQPFPRVAAVRDIAFLTPCVGVSGPWRRAAAATTTTTTTTSILPRPLLSSPVVAPWRLPVVAPWRLPVVAPWRLPVGRRSAVAASASAGAAASAAAGAAATAAAARQRAASAMLMGTPTPTYGGSGGADSSGDADGDAPPPSPFPLWLPAFATAAAGGLLFGYDIGSVSGVVRVLSSPAGSAAAAATAAATSPLGSLTALGALSAAQLGAIASASLAGALASSAAMFRYGDELGRRKELALAGGAYLLGTALQAVAPSVGVLLAGRVVYGLGIGLAMHAGPLYIAETAPASLRGLLVSAKEAAIVAGILGGYLAGATLQPDWRSIFAVAAVVEVPFAAAAALSWVPETPRWLLLRAAALEGGGEAGAPGGRGTASVADRVASLRSAAMTALAKLEGLSPAAARVRVDAMAVTVADTCLEATGQVARPSISSLYADPASQAALAVGLGCVVLQQVTGQPSVLYYANQLFDAAGFGFAAAVGLGAWKLLVTGVAAATADRAGRRPLLLAGTVGMTVALVALTVGFWGLDGAGGGATATALTGARQTWVLGSILLYVGAYQLGFGPVTWLLLSELFPLRVRSAAISVGVLVNFLTNFLVTAGFEAGRQSLGSGGLFAIFAALCAASVVFVAAKVPETKGLSLEAIEAQLQGEGRPYEGYSPVEEDGTRGP